MTLKRKKVFYIVITSEGAWEISTCLTSGIWAVPDWPHFFNKAQALLSQNQGQKAEKTLNVSVNTKPHRKGSQHIISHQEEITQQERADVENSSHHIPWACHPFPHHLWMERCCRDVRSVLGSSKCECWAGRVPPAAPALLWVTAPLPWRVPESSSSTENVLFPVTRSTTVMPDSPPAAS